MSSREPFHDWPTVMSTLVAGGDLDAPTAGSVMTTILRGDATAAQIGGFLVALRAKGESVEELAGLLEATLHEATFVPLTDDERANCLDIVGTGGDGSHSVNVSTMAALVAAGAGVPVCKHGNRSASSKCGTADVLEVLGVAIELHADGVAACVREAGIGFCFAPMFHPAFRFAGPPRREIGIPTVFNLLGPMANPGRVKRQLIGVADPQFAEPMIETLERQGLTDAWVVHGDGMDELTTTGRRGCSRSARGPSRSSRSTPPTTGWLRQPPTISVAGCPKRTPWPSGGCWRARRGRTATSCCSTPAPAWSWPDASTMSAPESRWRRPRSTKGMLRRASTR